MTWPHTDCSPLSLISRVRTAVTLPRDAQWLALRAIGALLVAPVVLRIFGWARVRRAIETMPSGPAQSVEFAAAVRRAIERAGRTIPWATCLPRALVAARLLRQAGLPAEIVIGVATPLDGGRRHLIQAHAWVRSGELVVAGDEELERYSELARFVSPQ